MSALAAISGINDGESPPVAHTFTPVGRTKDGFWIFEQTTPTPANALSAIRCHVRLVRESMSSAAGTKLGGAARVHMKMWVPIMETLSTNDAGITPPPTVAYTLFVESNYVLPERSSEQQRKNLRVLSSGAITSAQILDIIYKLQDLY